MIVMQAVGELSLNFLKWCVNWGLHMLLFLFCQNCVDMFVSLTYIFTESGF